MKGEGHVSKTNTQHRKIRAEEEKFKSYRGGGVWAEWRYVRHMIKKRISRAIHLDKYN